jgi:hypothetical protein
MEESGGRSSSYKQTHIVVFSHVQARNTYFYNIVAIKAQRVTSILPIIKSASGFCPERIANLDQRL